MLVKIGRSCYLCTHDGMYVCQCGCADVEGTAWLHLNSDALVGSEPPGEDYWCPACEEHSDRVVILHADGTNAGDSYEPFTLDPQGYAEKHAERRLAVAAPQLRDALSLALTFITDSGATNGREAVEKVINAALNAAVEG